MASSSSDREARRRRIAERGAERLALITGRIQTLPSLPSATSSPPLSHVLHSIEDKASSFDLPYYHSPVESDKINTTDGESRFEDPHNDSSVVSDEIGTKDGESKTKSSFPKLETSRDTSRASNKEQDVRSQSSHGAPVVQKSYRVESLVSRGKLFTPKQINSAIAATESTRIYCSIAVAILVSLSYIGFPLLANSITKSIIHYRPHYLVLITEISVVLKHLLLDGRGVQRPKRGISETPVVGGFGSAEQLAKVLELGLCFKNIMNALFMDFSIYAIVLVCSFAFAQKLS